MFPAIEENMLNNIHRFSGAQQLYDEAIALRKKKLVELKGVEEHIPVLKLQKSIPLRTIIWEVIKEKGFTAGQVDEVVKLMDADTGSFILSPTHRILKNRKWLIISLLTSGNNSHIVIENSDTKIVYSDCHLSLQNEIDADSFKIPTAGNIACFDSSQIKFPLVLRRWKRGDYFYPLGMKKKKKLNRFLIDQKLSLIQKEKIWVIEMDKKIIWVVGYRIDDRFKISPSTKSILQMRVTN